MREISRDYIEYLTGLQNAYFERKLKESGQNNLIKSFLYNFFPRRNEEGHYPKVYVSRRNFKLSGSLAGEGYIENILARHGFKIIYPEQLSMEQQLYYYANATDIVFSEGSAIHSLEVLGKINANVFCLFTAKRGGQII